MQMSGAEIIIRLLEQQGVTHISGMPGGANLPIYDALTRSAITHILARHEQGAGFMAQGMARVTGQPAVCLGTSGPGATNLLTAIADAKLDSIPLVAITGQVSRAMIGTDAFQEVDTYGLTLPITKHNFLVKSAQELLEVIPSAFRIAISGRPGPVVVDVPKDVQLETVDVNVWPEPGRATAPPVVNGKQLDDLLELITAARRPILYAGGGIMASGASSILQAVIEQACLPTTTTLMGLGAIPSHHPLFLGMLGMHAARFTNLALEECDLLIAAGARFDDRATGKVEQFCPQAHVVHIDVDASELGKIRNPMLSIHADIGDVLHSLLPKLPEINRSDWLDRLQALRDAFPLLTPEPDNPCSPYGIIKQTASMVDDDVIVTTDVGQHQMWVAQTYPINQPRQLLTSAGLGTMGFGLPAAIGAALAKPGRQVICFTGDGSLLINLQELVTAVEEQVNVKLIVMNNRHLGLVRQQQELFYGGRLSASALKHEPDFVALARAFGMPAWDLGTDPDPSATLRDALNTAGPALIHVPIPCDENVYPMVPPGGANHAMIGGEAYAHADV